MDMDLLENANVVGSEISGTCNFAFVLGVYVTNQREIRAPGGRVTSIAVQVDTPRNPGAFGDSSFFVSTKLLVNKVLRTCSTL